MSILTNVRNSIPWLSRTGDGDVAYTESGIIIGGSVVNSETTYQSALQCNAYAACVEHISSSIGEVTFGCGVKALDKRFKEPNYWQTGPEFFQSIVFDLLVHGHTMIELVGRPDRPMQLLPHNPTYVNIMTKGGMPHFQFPLLDGKEVDYRHMIWIKDIPRSSMEIHNRLDSIGLQVNALNAIDRLVDVTMHRGIFASYTISSDKEIGAKARAQLAKTMKTFTNDQVQAGKTMILDKGMRLELLPGLKGIEPELKSVRGMYVADVADRFGVPRWTVGGDTGEKYNNMAQQRLHMNQNALSPILGKIKAALSLKMGEEIVYDDEKIKQGDYYMQMQLYMQLAAAGLFTPNEIREMMDVAPCDDPMASRLLRQSGAAPATALLSNQQTNPMEEELNPPSGS